MILPGATLGLVGGGQLGRMFTMAARNLDYRVTVLDPDPLSPAAEFASGHLNTAYTIRCRSKKWHALVLPSRLSLKTHRPKR